MEHTSAIESTIVKLRELLLRRGIVDKNGIENAISIKNNITNPEIDPSIAAAYEELAHIITHTITRGIHAEIFKCLKTYRNSRGTGVFKVCDQFIIKYDSYTDLRLLKTYKKLGFGINHQYKLVTPIWYSFIERNNIKIGSTTELSVDINDINSNSESDDDVDKDYNDVDCSDHSCEQKKINIISNLMTLEIQPLLQGSIVFHEWYRRTHFCTQDHDYIITSMMLSVAKSIKYCHDLGLVHGDIKPDNIMVISKAGHCNENGSHVMRYNSHRIPDVYLIDFGMCGRDNMDEGTGGTRPFCAPETNNVNNEQEILAQNIRKRTIKNNGIQVTAVSGDEYMWGQITKEQDVWSFGLIIFTLISYYSVYYYYREYPMRTFDRAGFVRECELANDSEISNHPLYPVISKTLCRYDKRATIDEVISMIEVALVNMM